MSQFPPQQFQQQAPQQSSGVSPVVTVVVAIVVLTLLGVVIWQLATRTNAPALVPQPPPPPETEEQKKARLDKEAADKAAALTAESTIKEQALLDADVKASIDRLVNIPYELNQVRTLFASYRAVADSVNKPNPIAKSTETDPTKIALETIKNAQQAAAKSVKDNETKANLTQLALPFQKQRERALNSAGWGNYLALNIENRAKVLNKTTDATVAKAITDLRAASAAAFTALNAADTGADAMRDSKGCVTHMTGNDVKVVCPPGFNTFYNFGVAEPAECPVDGLCTRCIGFDFPKPVGGRSGTQWNNNKWQVPPGPSIGPVKEGEGSVMSFSGIYVVDGVYPDSQQCS